MGQLTHFDIGALIVTHGLKRFVETGTGMGHGVGHAMRFPFKAIESCEINAELAASVRAAVFQDNRISIHTAQSIPFIEAICANAPIDEPILWWLDAHFPGADYGSQDFGAEERSEIRLPLPDEIKTILLHRRHSGDVLLIDDLRIWCDGPFRNGGLPAHVRPHCPKDRSAEWFKTLLDPTHNVKFDFADEGYVIAEPKR